MHCSASSLFTTKQWPRCTRRTACHTVNVYPMPWKASQKSQLLMHAIFSCSGVDDVYCGMIFPLGMQLRQGCDSSRRIWGWCCNPEEGDPAAQHPVPACTQATSRRFSCCTAGWQHTVLPQIFSILLLHTGLRNWFRRWLLLSLGTLHLDSLLILLQKIAQTL